ncbi:MAG TPA: phosphoribosylglycinamide synthetase C domain-containing protein, partial [Aquella sp.]|nr:phosphoribosylglycinamide synthetase C domain-containing protein [Aquella sp.]
KFAIGVVLAAEGYPNSPRKNDIISGLDKVKDELDVQVFHAGTKISDGSTYTDGGRVLCVVGMDKDLKLAQKKVYAAIEMIEFKGMQYRTDIGSRQYL